MLHTEHILTLLKLPGIGRVKVTEIIHSAYETPRKLNELWGLIKHTNNNNAKIKVPEWETLEKSYENAKLEIEQCEKLNIHIIGICDDLYPKRLKLTQDAPVLIYAKGNLHCLNDQKLVAIVGTRKPSKYGSTCSHLFGKNFAEEGIVVVSGLAKGIDTSAHEGCIEVNGKTIAVLAQGLDTPIYPKENRPLADKIIAAGGCLISEYGLGVRGRPNYFVERNRIQSGISDGVAVIETDVKGGTMHTVGFCLKQEKPLGCLNHPNKFLVNNDKASGNQLLLEKKQAMPLFTPKDFEKFIQCFKYVGESSEDLCSKKNKSHSTPDQDDEQLSLF
ncbi:DNA-processing protein DprA [Allobacillus sp. SKP2-8]|uniref:DNA-processing protein DprA n=1 Tax=unclassified Allobacillus TaxID=2628859 RepID=UPI0011839D53|nr:DNA-processing protein DprA [Allobacillus sp. SKP2-8]TSJ69105.1 DNA-processing protein DprA [Allobacillus sp. SKP2-8]